MSTTGAVPAAGSLCTESAVPAEEFRSRAMRRLFGSIRPKKPNVRTEFYCEMCRAFINSSSQQVEHAQGWPHLQNRAQLSWVWGIWRSIAVASLRVTPLAV